MDIPSAALDKTGWRQRILAQRASQTGPERAAEARALAQALARMAVAGPVCAYFPTGTEPGGSALLAALTGVRVFLPVTAGNGPLRWGEFSTASDLVPARFGLREPANSLPPETISLARTVLVPALAVDEMGVRLGRGAGHYDRSLTLANPDARLVAVVRDTELVARLPEEPHDHRLGWALTPGRGLVRLGNGSADLRE